MINFSLNPITIPFGENIFSSYDQYAAIVPPPPSGQRYRILPDGTYRVTNLTLTTQSYRIIDITP
jgi:hypothetical protein